jgi:flagellar motor switch protein FliN
MTVAPSHGLGALNDVQLDVTVELGRLRLSVRDLLSVQPGSVLALDRVAGAPVDVLVNGSPVARGEIVMVNDRYGVRLTELLDRS